MNMDTDTPEKPSRRERRRLRKLRRAQELVGVSGEHPTSAPRGAVTDPGEAVWGVSDHGSGMSYAEAVELWTRTYPGDNSVRLTKA